MRAFDRGPYALSRRSKNAPSGLFMPPDVRLVYNAVTSIYWLPQAASSVGGPPDSTHRDVVMWWRRKTIAFPPIDALPGAAASQGGRFNLQTTTKLLLANGGDSASGMSASTLYYVYVNPDGFVRASATAYSYSWEGVRVLGRSGSAKDWLFIGYVRTDASTNFLDSITSRLVVNWYNRIAKALYTSPGYSDNNATTTWTTASTTWTRANAGTGSTLEFIANGEDAVTYQAHHQASDSSPTASTPRSGVGESSQTSATVFSGNSVAGSDTNVGVGSSGRTYIPAEGYQYLELLARADAGTVTFYVDEPRNGSTADPAGTFITAVVRA